jgi:hypothetical protein
MPNLIAGWCVFWLLMVHTAMITVPIVADRYKIKPAAQTVCPMLQIQHGVGSDLRTFTVAKDLCANG